MGPAYSSWTYIITLVDLTYTAFIVPISVAFDEVQGNTGFSWINIVDIVGCAWNSAGGELGLFVCWFMAHGCLASVVVCAPLPHPY